MDDYLVKPFKPNDLCAKLETLGPIPDRRALESATPVPAAES
jgi:DNA-binding response OmpR family regulator